MGAILLLSFTIFHIYQSDQPAQATYTVTLLETSCLSTRRMRCGYHFVEVSNEKEQKDERHFDVVFYIGANQMKDKEDAISRLDRFFKIKREAPSNPSLANTGTVGFKEPVILRIEGSKYEFDRKDGHKIVVDIAKKTEP